MSNKVPKTLKTAAIETVCLIFDVLYCFVFAIPIILHEGFRLIYRSRKDIRGKLALVSGGGNGLGRGICLKLAEQGCNVAVVDVNLEAAEQTVDEIKSRGFNAKAFKVDVTKTDEILKLRAELAKSLGPVDILVNNAGLMSNANMDEKPENIEAMVKVNVLGPILMSKYFLEQMKENQSGHIVSIASLSGLHVTPFSVPYSSTKFGINGFMAALTEHLRIENWRSKIKTTCVFPYYIKTRADIIDFLNPDIRYPALEIDETAHEVVEGILREDFTITIPNNQKPLVKFMSVLPLRIQELVRDRVLREFEFVNRDCKLNFDFK